jgi:hypothetical protein
MPSHLQEVHLVLRDKRLVVDGVLAPDMPAYAVAERALLEGAHVTLTAPPSAFPRCRELCERLPRGAHAVRIDVTSVEDQARLREHLRCAYGAVDGVVADVTPAASALEGRLDLLVGASPLAGLLRATAPLLDPDTAAVVGVVALPDDDRLAPAVLQACQEAARQASRSLRWGLGARGLRANVVAADQQALRDVARTACLLLDAASATVTGAVLRPGDPAGEVRNAAPPALAM